MAQSQAEILAFHANVHSYAYKLRDGSRASSRLDRWYISHDQYGRVQSAETVVPVCPTDHDGVVLVLAKPSTQRRVAGRRAISYPIPEYATAALSATSERHVTRLAARALHWTAQEAQQEWDTMKSDFRRDFLIAKLTAAQKLDSSLKQRIRRAKAALIREKQRHLAQAPPPTAYTVAGLTSELELLTLDSGERAASLRGHLIALQRLKATRRQRRAIHQYDGHGPSAIRAFYRRMSTRFSKPRVVGPGDKAVSAQQLAQDWRPVIQQAPPTTAAQDAFFERIQHPETPPSNEPFTDFTADEVLAAIAVCPAGKAGGPDGIPNDRYRSVSAEIVPALASTLFKWVRAGKLPASFKEATIFCIPKVAAPKNGLDYRPISLLNTDYKIFSRLILQRVQRQAAAVISAAQFGFVGQRQVHDAINVWEAIQARIENGELPPEAVAVMLDFAKAHLVAVVDAMHLSTTARFLADGDMPGVTSILNGIRQGCPLAPVLFILALDLLYKAADADPNLTGLQVDAYTRVKLSGYADHTTSYLAPPDEERYLLRLLDQFGAASGLRINLSKSRALVIHPEGPTAAHAQMTIPVQPAKELLRYLGKAVASNPSTAAIWSRTLQQVRATLHVAYAKTTNLPQRVALCSVVIMPKLLFVGRHSWPTSAIFTDLQSFLHRYAWHGSLAHAASGRRAWMSAEAAMLPTAQGGIGLPDVRSSFIKMSASVVARWHASSNPVAAAAGQVLLRLRGGGPAARVPGPSRAAPPPPRVSPSLAATGTATQRAAGAMPPETEERTALATLLPVTDRGPTAVKWCDRGWFYCTYTTRATNLKRLRLIQHRHYGDFNLAALLACQAVGADILALGAHTVEQRDFPQLILSGDAINDIVHIQWVDHLHVCFQCVWHAWPISPRVVAQFCRFCNVFVHNYPGVLHLHNGPPEIQPRPPTFSEWHIAVTPDGLKSLICVPVPGARIDLGPVATLRVASRVARQHEPTLVRFDPHPLFDPYAPI